MEAIRIENLTKKYKDLVAVDNLSLYVNEGELFSLLGVNGAGKTTLISSIMEYLGSNDTVTSPTFALVNQYGTAAGEVVYHFDFYRINRIEEVYDMGYEEYFYSGDLCLIEWPELIEDLLPEDAMVVRIEVLSPTERRFTIA